MASRLPTLPEVERISPSVIRILGGNPGSFTLQGTNTYLLGTGSERLLIDTGEGKSSWTNALTDLLHEENASIQKALVTHWHLDHVGGIHDLRQLESAAEIHKYPLSTDSVEMYLPMADGDVFAVQGTTLHAVHCPGHTKDHVVFILEEENALFSGDAILGHGTAVFEDLGTYMDSLKQLGTLGIARIYPAHGAVIEDGPSKIGEYIQHREMREKEIMKAVETSKQGDGPVQAGELVQKIYGDIEDGLRKAAERSVCQVLGKLERERKVKRVGEGWSSINSLKI